MMNKMKIKETLGSEFAFFFENILNPVIAKLNLSKEANILDIGTGMGRMAITLALNGYNVLTGEPEGDDSEYAKQDWLKSAKRVYVEHKIAFKTFNAEKMPFNDNEFDAIFILGALHHIDNKISAIRECRRTLKNQGGVICIIEPNGEGLERVREIFPTHPDAVDPRKYFDEQKLVLMKVPMFDVYIYKN